MESTKTYLIDTCYLYTKCLYCNKDTLLKTGECIKTQAPNKKNRTKEVPWAFKIKYLEDFSTKQLDLLEAQNPIHRSLNVSTSYNTSSYDIITPNYGELIHKHETSKSQETSFYNSDASIDNNISTSYENNSYDITTSNYDEEPILYNLFEDNFHISEDEDHDTIKYRIHDKILLQVQDLTNNFGLWQKDYILAYKYFQAISKQKEVIILITITSKKRHIKLTDAHYTIWARSVINRFNDTDSPSNYLIFQAPPKPRGIKNCDTGFESTSPYFMPIPQFIYPPVSQISFLQFQLFSSLSQLSTLQYQLQTTQNSGPISILEEFVYKVDKEENANREIAKYLEAFNQEAIR
ncbi:4790_t:CDS:2, partial [Racocetra persica]